MRIGRNPLKHVDSPLADYPRHRVIVCVHIPQRTGYFLHGLEVLWLCLQSLKHAAGMNTNVTIIANGCCESVISFLLDEYSQGWIDQLVMNRLNRGKVDAILPVARGCFEEMITIADADVLFDARWFREITRVFQAFPECGVVLQPNPRHAWTSTVSTVADAFLRQELRWEQVVPGRDLEQFARSIGSPALFEPIDFRSQLIVSRDGVKACVGGGHYAFAMRREVIRCLPDSPSRTRMGGAAMAQWLDVPPDRNGFWRLAPTEVLLRHMGNTPEPWMEHACGSDEWGNAGETLAALPKSDVMSAPRLPFSVRRGIAFGARKTLLRRRANEARVCLSEQGRA